MPNTTLSGAGKPRISSSTDLDSVDDTRLCIYAAAEGKGN
eukprot:CAMPEP_0194075962 /NCGR_PEP_ID=MMETSP0149-20130528/2846_1 /TAXON_ID=122233 /ORGANISM="Chaetoceros debilis, Strain MM31A-1" /LENGTH=39 /DNA_ID= /DNA_START= /DNA_END= /DNA_ORIENTATION=